MFKLNNYKYTSHLPFSQQYKNHIREIVIFRTILSNCVGIMRSSGKTTADVLRVVSFQKNNDIKM